VKFQDNNRCALCGKLKEEGRKIIVGLHGSVCSDCVSLCNDILQTGGAGVFEPKPTPGLFDRIREMMGSIQHGSSALDQLVAMTRELASSVHQQVILGEGNTSALDGSTLWVKATGHQMPTISHDGFVQVDLRKVVQILDAPKPNDEELRELLNAARTEQSSPNFPSTETFMHAWLLTLPDVNFVAHTHPETTLGIMCGPRARQFAEQRFFPDQIVLCGPRSVFVPYCAPGYELALAIRDACGDGVPKTILLENHGLIALGRTAKEALSACLMMEKAAIVFATAVDPHALTPDEVEHIHTWTDEHFRQGKIWSE
jgi:rhamnose utilization protein RhaD (predicted bifunctional aldolase and dehydrogenase)